MEYPIIKVEPGALVIRGDQFAALVEMFLSSQDVKANSKETYRRALKRFISWYLQEKITNPTREEILRYKNFLETENLSAFTLSCYLVAVRRFFEWAESMRIYPNIGNSGNNKNERRA